MLKWLRPKKPEGPIATSSFRAGRRGICALCGAIKSGSFVECQDCHFLPIGENDLVVAFALNEDILGSQFESFAFSVRSGEKPVLPQTDHDQILTQIRTSNLRKVLGFDQPIHVRRYHSEAIVGGLCLQIVSDIPKLMQALEEPRSFRRAAPLQVLAAFGLVGRSMLLLGRYVEDSPILETPEFQKRVIRHATFAQFHNLCHLSAQDFQVAAWECLNTASSLGIRYGDLTVPAEEKLATFILNQDELLLRAHFEEYERRPIGFAAVLSTLMERYEDGVKQGMELLSSRD